MTLIHGGDKDISGCDGHDRNTYWILRVFLGFLLPIAVTWLHRMSWVINEQSCNSCFFRARYHVKGKMAENSWGRAQWWRERRRGRGWGWTGGPSSASSPPWPSPRPTLPSHSPPPGRCLPSPVLLSWKTWIFPHPDSPPSWVRSPFLAPVTAAWPTFFLKEC